MYDVRYWQPSKKQEVGTGKGIYIRKEQGTGVDISASVSVTWILRNLKAE
jgi:hypothetical protein